MQIIRTYYQEITSIIFLLFIFYFQSNNTNIYMKGIHIQFESIISFLESAMVNHIVNQTEDCFFLNVQKMTFETFKLVDIIFTDLENNIPKNIHIDFNNTVNKLKEYFKIRPKTKTQEDEFYREQYDQVSRYLDNRPQMATSNDQARGQLFKYLSLAQQKESNTKTLLSAIPRYSNANMQQQLTIFNSPHGQSSFVRNSKYNDSISDTNLNNIVEDSNRFHQLNANNVIKSKKNQSYKYVSQQTQTEYNLDILKLIISDFTKNQLKSSEQTYDFASKISAFLDNNLEQMKTKQMAVQIDINELQKEEMMQLKKSKTQKSLVNDKINQKALNKSKKNKQQNKKLSKQLKSLTEIKEQNNHTNNQCLNKEKQSQQFMQKHDKSIENEKFSIQNETKLRTNEKRIKNYSQFKKQKLQNQKKSKIEKLENQNLPQQNYPSFLNINEYKQSQKTDISKEKIIVNMISENKQNLAFQEQIYSPLIRQNTDGEQIDKQQYLKRTDQCKTKSGNVSNSRQKIFSNKGQTQIETNKTFEQACNTYNQSKYRNGDCKEDGSKNILPKIHQKIIKTNESEKSESLKRKIQNSPYAKQLIQYQDQKLSRSSLANQFNNRSLHMNPSQSLFLPKDVNRTFYRDSMKQFFPSGERQKNGLPNIETEQEQAGQSRNIMTEEQRQVWLKQQHDRLMTQIEENIGTQKNKNMQFLKAIKSIRQYQVMHLRFCGQNCIHLQKFNEFLKRKNISMYANRKQLYLPKRNIEINLRNK